MLDFGSVRHPLGLKFFQEVEKIKSHLVLPKKQNTLLEILYKARVSVNTLPVPESSLEHQDLGCGHSRCQIEYPGTEIFPTLYRPPQHIPNQHLRGIPQLLGQRGTQTL